MNRPDRNHPWSRFLAAEELGRAEAAEAALGELFEALPELRPPAGFASRVMARLERRRSWLARPGVRLALAAALLAVAVSTALFAPLLGPLAEIVGPGGALGFVVGAFAGLATRFADGLAIWSPVGTAARAIGRALLEPRLVALLVTQFLIAALALRGLAGVVTAQRSSVHGPH